MHPLAPRHLAAHLERLAAVLAASGAAATAGAGGSASGAPAAGTSIDGCVARLAEIEREAGDPRDLPIGRLVDRLRLDPVSLDALLLAAAPALAPSLASVCGLPAGALFTPARIAQILLPDAAERLA